MKQNQHFIGATCNQVTHVLTYVSLRCAAYAARLLAMEVGMFGLDESGSSVFVFGGRKFKKLSASQREILRQGRWSLHFVRERRGWKNYVLYFDATNLEREHRKVQWQLSFDGTRVSESKDWKNLSTFSPDFLKWVVMAVAVSPGAAMADGVPREPGIAPVGRPRKATFDPSVDVMPDFDARIEGEIDRQWRIGVLLRRSKGFACIHSVCLKKFKIPREYTQAFLIRKTRQKRIRFDVGMNGYRLVEKQTGN